MRESVILGREAELDELRGFLAAVPTGPSALLLQGAAGIGKTTLWLEGLTAAKAMGHRTLATRAAESEARLSYAALGDLVGDHLTEALPTLPVPQRRALETALLRAETAEVVADPQAVSLAALGVIRHLSVAGPVVIAIDDVQWLDAPSARVVSFVLRRLRDDPVGLLASLRVGAGSPGDPLRLDHVLPTVTRLDVGPLGQDELGRLMRERTGTDLPRPVVVKLYRVSHGNPLFALEIARAMARGGLRLDPGGQFPVPEDLQQLLSARIAALPLSAHAPLLALAALSQPTVELVLVAAESEPASRSGLAQAETAGVVERAYGRVRFTHPLLASTVYVNASARERRELHARLADIVEDPEERARHLALASDGPDAQVAGALDEAAHHARTRGAPDAAAELIELARRLTPGDAVDERRRRSLQAAEYHFDAGDASRALDVLKEAIGSTPPGRKRAEMLFRLSGMSWMNLIKGVREPAERAAREAGADHELQSGVHMTLSWVAFYLGDLDQAWHHAKDSVRFATDLSTPGTRADALATLGVVEFLRGRPADDLMTEAIELQDLLMREGSWTEGSVYTTPRSILGLELMWSGRLDEARSVFERELAEYEKHAMYTVRQEVLCYLAELECRAGRWRVAADLAAEAMETVVESGQTATQSHVALFNQALPAAHLGQEQVARRLASEGVELALANDDLFNASLNRAVLGFLELSLSNFEQAHAQLEPVVRYVNRMGSAEPAILPCIPDDVEALVGLGRPDEAVPLVDRLQDQGRVLNRSWALATASRCRGLIAAAKGELDDALIALEAALAEHDRAAQPFEWARSMLVLGQVQRRLKRKSPARESLQEARDTFARLGAVLWLGRAESELSRIGGRAPSPLELTATERSVAELVAVGRTNREVADALFVSPSTVSANLKRIYRKLGVRTRTELAAGLRRVHDPAE